MINSYSFGNIVVDGKRYTADLIIFPDRTVLCPWWRDKGHTLRESYLADLLAAGPELVVCGTGVMGLMRPAKGLAAQLHEAKVEFIAERSTKAVETYNRLAGEGKVGACFHLTC